MVVCNIGSKPGGILKHTEEPNPLKIWSSLQSVLNARMKHSNVIFKNKQTNQDFETNCKTCGIRKNFTQCMVFEGPLTTWPSRSLLRLGGNLQRMFAWFILCGLLFTIIVCLKYLFFFFLYNLSHSFNNFQVVSYENKTPLSFLATNKTEYTYISLLLVCFL